MILSIENLSLEIQDVICDDVYKAVITHKERPINYCAKKFDTVTEAVQYSELMKKFDSKYIVKPLQFIVADKNGEAYVIFERLESFELWNPGEDLYTCNETENLRFGDGFRKVFSQISDGMAEISARVCGNDGVVAVVKNLRRGGVMYDAKTNRIKLVSFKTHLTRGCNGLIEELKQNLKDFAGLIEDTINKYPTQKSSSKFKQEYATFTSLVQHITTTRVTDVDKFVTEVLIWGYNAPIVWGIKRQIGFIYELDHLIEVLSSIFRARHFLRRYSNWKKYLPVNLHDFLIAKPEAKYVVGTGFSIIRFFRNYLEHINGEGESRIEPKHKGFKVHTEAFLELIEVFPGLIGCAYCDLVRRFANVEILPINTKAAMLVGKMVFDVLNLDAPTADTRQFSIKSIRESS